MTDTIPHRTSSSGLSSSLKDLYVTMSKTTEEVTPAGFLNTLRQAFPQFAERARAPSGLATKGMMGAYAQQGR